MQSATQPVVTKPAYTFRAVAADLTVGALAYGILFMSAALFGGFSFYTPWLLFVPPLLLGAGYLRGTNAGRLWLRAVLMNAPSLLLFRGAGIVTFAIALLSTLTFVVIGLVLGRRFQPATRTRRIIARLSAAIAGILLPVAVASLWWLPKLEQTNGTIVSSGMTRRYLLHVPKSYDGTRAVPLLISLHPAASWPWAEEAISRWSETAEERGFLVVYPAGRGFPQVWPMGAKSAETDAKFISDLIDKISGEYKIDPARVYADGISNGGGMAFAVSCRLPSRIAAVGAIAAAESLPFSWCVDTHAVPMIAFHGSADPVAPYTGGASRDPANPLIFPDIRKWTANWAQRNQCGATAAERRITEHVRQTAYSGCLNSADVVLYTIEGGGHTWPGGKQSPEWMTGATSREIEANRLMWEFFEKHPRAK